MTIHEIATSCYIYILIVIVFFALIKYGSRSWKSVETRMDAQKSIQLAKSVLRAELARTAYSSIVVYQPDGDYRHAICFKSAIDDNGAFATDAETGRPVWQKHMLFYLAKPKAPALHPGVTCAAETGKDGSDLKCPHKWLIRKELPLEADITASPESLKPFLAEPEDVSALQLPESNVRDARVIAQDLLGLTIGRTESSTLREVTVSLKIFKTREAMAAVSVGSVDLSASPFTLQVDVSVIPLD